MTTANIQLEPSFPWLESVEDRRFNYVAIASLLIFMSFGIALNQLALPELEQRKLVDVSPRLAKLILEKKKIPPPPPKEIPPPEKIIKEPVKKETVAKEEIEPVKKPKISARDTAKKSGLIALSDELSDLRESFDLDDALELPQQNNGENALAVASTSALLTTQAKQSSGGITTSNLNRKIGSTELATRKTTKVTSNIESTKKTKQKVAAKSGKLSTRSSEEIELVFQKNKGAIFTIYNRALRKNPSLQGKVVLELTIDADGSVSQVKIISSELNDANLEKKLLLKIKRFKFAKTSVAKITVTYPIDFLPS